ncbi:hypothetical protein N7G274_000417 [Stereocaulon virgatum]|uniref:Uncharacterized protein n=1 Tax=Stereocaulon virgatum TaxID=373712 RepID=A0ABR4ASS1_9LECA
MLRVFFHAVFEQDVFEADDHIKKELQTETIQTDLCSLAKIMDIPADSSEVRSAYTIYLNGSTQRSTCIIVPFCYVLLSVSGALLSNISFNSRYPLMATSTRFGFGQPPLRLHIGRILSTNHVFRSYSTSYGITCTPTLTSSFVFSEYSAYFAQLGSTVGFKAALPIVSPSRSISFAPYCCSQARQLSQLPRSAGPTRHRTALALEPYLDSGVCRIQDGNYTAKVLVNGISRRLPQTVSTVAKLTPIQRKAQERWQRSKDRIRSTFLQKDFDPNRFLRIFDNCLLLRLLCKHVTVDWVTSLPNQYGHSGNTSLRRDERGNKRVLIQLIKPSAVRYWAESTMQKILETLLIEMVNALFLLYACHCPSCLATGQELSKAKLLAAFAEKANIYLTGLTRCGD